MKVLKLLIALGIAYVALVPPIQFLWKAFQPIPIHYYDRALQWRYDHGSIDMYPGCAYVFQVQSGAYIANCVDRSKDQATDDLDSVPLDIPLSIPKSFLSEMLRIPNTPLEQEVCFQADHYFKDFPDKKFTSEMRVFLYPKPVKKLQEVDTDELIVLTFNKLKCIQAMSGMTIIGLGQGNAMFFDQQFIDGIEVAAKFQIPPITESGGKVFLGDQEAKRTLIERRGDRALYQIEAPFSMDSFEFSIVNSLNVYARLSFIQKIVLVIAVLSVWLLAVQSLIKSAVELTSKFIEILGAATMQLYGWLKRILKAIRNAWRKMWRIITRLKLRIRALIQKVK